MRIVQERNHGAQILLSKTVHKMELKSYHKLATDDNDSTL